MAEIRTSEVVRSDFNYHTLCANAVVGITVYSKIGYTVKQEQVDDARAILARRGQTFEAYAESLCREETDHTAKILRDNTGKWFVEMWSMSETSARKAASALIKAPGS